MSPSPALSGALSRVGDRWSLLIVEALLDGPQRFGDLQGSVPGIATNVLSQRLRRLEAGHLITAVPYSRRPMRYSYSLSDAGRALAGAVRLLAQWSADHGAGPGATPGHEVCGTPMEARWWCPTCEVAAGREADEAALIWI